MKPDNTANPFDPAEAMIRAGEAPVLDEDNPPTSQADWEGAVVTHGGGVAATLAELRRHRGTQEAPPNVPIALSLSPEVVAYFKATGKDWQTRIDDALKEYVQEHSD